MKKILIGLLLISFLSHADKSATSVRMDYGMGEIQYWVQDSNECQACLTSHQQCILSVMEPKYVVMDDVVACDTVEHKCLASNQCRNKE
jgi:hypothetical protein